MSVMVMVNDAKSTLEENFFFPIAGEDTYAKYWFEFADKNDLLWLKAFQYGIDLEKQYFDDVKNELNIFLAYLEKDKNRNDFLIRRVHLFLSKLEEAKLMRSDISLYVG